MKTKSGGGSKSLVRLLAAIEGFYVKHGHWPMRVRVFPGFIHSIKNDILSEAQYAALASKIELVPDEEAPVVAEDSEGRTYSYGMEGFSKSKPVIRAEQWLGL